MSNPIPVTNHTGVQSLTLNQQILQQSQDLISEANVIKKLLQSFFIQVNQPNSVSSRARAITTNPQGFSWENGAVFLLHILFVAHPSEQDLAQWSLVCKKWNNVINSEEFASLRFKCIAPIDYRGFFPYARMGLEWKAVYKVYAIEEKIKHNLDSIENSKRSLTILRSENISQKHTLNSHFDLINSKLESINIGIDRAFKIINSKENGYWVQSIMGWGCLAEIGIIFYMIKSVFK